MNVKELGLTLKKPEIETLSVTVAVKVWPLEAVMFMLDVYVPEVRPAGLIEIRSELPVNPVAVRAGVWFWAVVSSAHDCEDIAV